VLCCTFDTLGLETLIECRGASEVVLLGDDDHIEMTIM
jgi:hypothetical protein